MKDKLKELVSIGEINRVYEVLLKICQLETFKYYENAVWLSKIRYTNLQLYKVNTIQSDEQQEVSFNRFILTLLEIINNIWEEKENSKVDLPDYFNISDLDSGIILNKNEILIKSPHSGTIYLSENPQSNLLIREGKKIKEDDLIFLLEEMKNYNYIESFHNGTIKRLFVQNGQSIESDKPIFILELDKPEKELVTDHYSINSNKPISRDLISPYAPVLGKSRKIKNYIIITPLQGELILPDHNKILHYTRQGIRYGDCIYQVKHENTTYDIVSPFDAILIQIINSNGANLGIHESIYIFDKVSSIT